MSRADCKTRYSILILLCFMFTGCATNGFQQFYKGRDAAQIMASSDMETCSTPSIYALPAENLITITNTMFTEGFYLVGESEWNGPASEGDREAIEHGKNIGACVVLWKADYSDTTQSSMNTTMYVPGGTTTTTHSGSIYSGGTRSSYIGTSTTQNPGTITTQSIPYSIRRYNYRALYFARLVNKPHALMVKLDSPPDSYMRATDSRTGLLVTAVMKNGNSYRANIFPGDIIMEINNQPTSMDALPQTLMRQGDNEFKIYRDGNTIIKTINIPPR